MPRCHTCIHKLYAKLQPQTHVTASLFAPPLPGFVVRVHPCPHTHSDTPTQHTHRGITHQYHKNSQQASYVHVTNVENSENI